MTTSWGNQVTEVACPWGCGEPVLSFIDELGLRRYLEPLPITTDLRDPDIAWRVWEFRGRPVGWTIPFFKKRSGRPIRIEHLCAGAPKSRRRNAGRV